jgi:hypothetical protein
LAAVEVLLPNLTRNVSVPFSQPFLEAKSEAILKNQPAWGERLFTQRDLSLEREPRQLLHQFKRIDQGIFIKQSFIGTNSELRGITLDLRWSKKQEKNIKMSLDIQDENTKELQKIFFSTANLNPQKPLEIIFPKSFNNVFGHNFSVSISQQEAQEGPWISYVGYPNNLNTDYLPGGHASFCVQDKCETPAFDDTAEPDIALTPLYSNFNRIKLSQEILSPHIGASKNIPSTQWLGALQLKEVKRYLYEIGDQNENADGFNPFLEKRRELLNRLGVGYLLGSYQNNRSLGDLKEVEMLQEYQTEGQTVRLFKNLEVAPRAEFVTNAQSVTSPDGARAVLFDAQKPNDAVPVEDDTLLIGKKLSDGDVIITSYQPNEVILKTTNRGEGFVILRDMFFEDWHAYIDGQETRIYPTDWIFRGVLVPAGEHTVTFKYTPTNTINAIKISLTAWAILIVFILASLTRKYFRRRS